MEVRYFFQLYYALKVKMSKFPCPLFWKAYKQSEKDFYFTWLPCVNLYTYVIIIFIVFMLKCRFDMRLTNLNFHFLAICREISHIKNGEVHGSGSLEDNEISFICDQHYVLVGEKALRCTYSGKWNASEPKCIGTG